jgi:radical SAM superfamily enzyme YgiQ (UPF0313 family)
LLGVVTTYGQGYALKITLINPPYIFSSLEELGFSQCIGLRSISAFLKQEGFTDITIIDALHLGFHRQIPYNGGFLVGLEIEGIVERIPPNSDLIGISAPFSILAPVVHKLISAVRKQHPCATIVMGGVYPSTQPHLSLTSDTDYIVIGEGELAFLDLARGKNPQEISGVYSAHTIRSATEGLKSAPRIQDLDCLPMIDYQLPGIDTYFSRSPRGKAGRVASIITSRGCPFACEFCSIHPVYGRTYRTRSADKVLEEIQFLVENFRIQALEIEDDNFTLSKDRTIQILQGIKQIRERGTNLRWTTPNGIRIDTLDEEVIRLIAASGCAGIALALEHGDPEMLRLMNKKLDLNKALDVIRLLIEYKIPCINLFFIVGYPGETRERFENAVLYLQRIKDLGKQIFIDVYYAQTYPGTRLSQRCLEDGLLAPGFDNYLNNHRITSTESRVTITSPDFTREEVMRRKAVLETMFMERKPAWKQLLKKVIPRHFVEIMRNLGKTTRR